jgi:hypothetical protein
MHFSLRHVFLSVAACLIFSIPGLCAEIELPFLIGDGTVVQRQKPIPVWGVV